MNESLKQFIKDITGADEVHVVDISRPEGPCSREDTPQKLAVDALKKRLADIDEARELTRQLLASVETPMHERTPQHMLDEIVMTLKIQSLI